jgi:general stress protein 26
MREALGFLRALFRFCAMRISDTEKRQRLKKLISGFKTAMLVTRTKDGRLRSRPLNIAGLGEDGALYFCTAFDSEKTSDLKSDAHVNVSMQDKRRFVSITGIGHIEIDRELVHRLWAESWRIWFPMGKNDPSLCLLVVDPKEATSWDMTGADGLRYLFESAKAYVTGTPPPTNEDQRHVAHLRLS